MDSILTEFIQRTRADPALAQDLLEATDWNLDMAIMTYDSFHETKVVEPPEYVYDPSKCWTWLECGGSLAWLTPSNYVEMGVVCWVTFCCLIRQGQSNYPENSHDRLVQ